MKLRKEPPGESVTTEGQDRLVQDYEVVAIAKALNVSVREVLGDALE